MDQAVEIIVRDNGSLRVIGPVVLKDGQGNVFDLAGRTSFSLCRCGHSQNKPFCDSTHKTIGWQSIVQARKLSPPEPKST